MRPLKRLRFESRKLCFWSHLFVIAMQTAHSENSSVAGSSNVFKSLLKEGKTNKKCTVCNRHLSEFELQAFEKYVRVTDAV